MSDRILVVDDEVGIREGLRRLLEAWGYAAETAASADEALDRIAKSLPSAVLTDLVMPGMDGLEFVRRLREETAVPVVVFSGEGTIAKAVEAMRLGALDFVEKPVDAKKLESLLARLELVAEVRRLRGALKERGLFERLRGNSAKMQAVFQQIEQVAPSTLSVLIVGESGTGKELVAQTLHDLSPRKRHEFVAVNCAAIPATLLESEIFGHERGAFTGAVQRKAGCFEMAHRGTLFLDEISEMDEILQAKLLRVLQEQRFRRLGGRDIIEADVRVLAATNREPMKAIAEGKLREDLYYRLNVFTIQLPPLRERPEDVAPLVLHFAKEFAGRNGTKPPTIDAAAMERLLAHAWPGNVRELKNAVERAALLAGSGGIVRPEHLPPEVAQTRIHVASAGPVPTAEAVPTGPVVHVPVGSSMDDAERELIRSTLGHTSGNKTRAAKILGISLKTMHNKVKKYGL